MLIRNIEEILIRNIEEILDKEMKWMVRLKAVMVTIYDDQCDQGDQNNDLIDPILLSRPVRL